MTKYVGAVLAVLLAVSIVSFGRKEETLGQLVARADAAKPDKQPDLYMEAAERGIKSAGDLYKGDHPKEFREALQQIIKFCDSAHAAAMQSNKHIKSTEIKIRRISLRLRDIKFDADMDDQPQVQTAIDRLESFRTELLHSMFGSKSND
jgi:hypothetical protein